MTTAFEARYRTDPDPWGTLSDVYEVRKRRRTLELCGPGPFAAACELGAGLGVLAAELGERCGTLLALDVAPTAVAAARRRLAALPHAEARVACVPADLPAGPFDLVVASEILYYLTRPDLDRVVAWLGEALVAHGRLVAVHWVGTAPDLRVDARAVGAALAASPALRVLCAGDGATDGFRTDVLERRR